MRNVHALSERMRADYGTKAIERDIVADWVMSVEELEVALEEARSHLKDIRKLAKNGLKASKGAKARKPDRSVVAHLDTTDPPMPVTKRCVLF